MPYFEVDYRVEGYGWATFEADDLADAEAIALDYFDKGDMDVAFLAVEKMTELPKDPEVVL